MDHGLITGIERALNWDGPGSLGSTFARGRLPDPRLAARLLTPTRLLDLLLYRSLTRPQVRCLQGGAELHPREYLTATTSRRGQRCDLVDTGRLGRLLGEGCTLVVDALNHLDPVVDVACRALQWWSGNVAQANAYLTTGDAAGFDLHFDDHDVIVVQVAGAKTWEVRGASRIAPLYRDVDPNIVPSDEVVWSGTLATGEVMAIPRGFWHQATRDDQDRDGYSLHVTFGLSPRTGVDWVNHLADLSREQELFRHDLSERTDHAALAKAVAALARTHSPAEFLEARRAEQATPRRVVTSGAFGALTSVVCVTAFPPHVEAAGDKVTVSAGGRRLVFAAPALPALQVLLSGRPADLGGVAAMTGVDTRRLAAVLVEEGLCAEVTEASSSAYTELG